MKKIISPMKMTNGIQSAASLNQSISLCALQHIHEQEQSEPHHVYEMPIPGDRFEREMVILGEMVFVAAEPDHGEHDRAERHVQTVETVQHEERRAVDARAQREIHLGIGL